LLKEEGAATSAVVEDHAFFEGILKRRIKYCAEIVEDQLAIRGGETNLSSLPRGLLVAVVAAAVAEKNFCGYQRYRRLHAWCSGWMWTLSMLLSLLLLLQALRPLTWFADFSVAQISRH